jgi:hypothetical protein
VIPNLSIFQRIICGIGQTIKLQINIEVRPIKMKIVQTFYIKYFFYLCFFKPRILPVRQKIFFALDIKPEATGIDIGNFNF